MAEKIYEEAWKYAYEDLKQEYKLNGQEGLFTLNFNMNYVEDENDVITVSVASNFLQQMMSKRGSFEIIQNKIREITDIPSIKIKCIVKPEKKETNPSDKIISESSDINVDIEIENAPVKKEEKKEYKKHPLLQENFTFESFIPGDNSDYAYKASMAVSENPGKKFNPILLYGGSGLGKTHLMQAIGNYIYNKNDKLKICYISAENFGNEFTSSLASKKINEFKNKYRNLDVLLLDDIHFLQNKEGMQAELFYTFDALHQKNAQMVFTCDRPIREIKNMTDRLVSRLSNGLCINLEPPNYETRIAIIKKKVELMGKTLDPEIIEYIAKNIETNVRELESALKSVFGYAELTGQNPTLENAKIQLKDTINSSSNENISLETIQKVIADNYQISVSELKGKKKEKKFVIPRQIAIYISRELTEISYTELGNEFGGRDHSTIMHAYEKVDEQIKLDSNLESKINLFIREIKEYKKND